MNSSGQASIETMGALLFLSTAISIGVFTSYFGFAHLWLSHLVHEGVMCVAEGDSANYCRSLMLEGAQKYLPYGKLTLAYVSPGPEVFRGQINLLISGEQKWEIKKHYRISSEEIQAASH